MGNLALPSKRDAPYSQPVIDQGAFSKFDWSWSQDFELEPRRRDGFEVLRIAKECKDLLDICGEQLIAVELENLHFSALGLTEPPEKAP